MYTTTPRPEATVVKESRMHHALVERLAKLPDLPEGCGAYAHVYCSSSDSSVEVGITTPVDADLEARDIALIRRQLVDALHLNDVWRRVFSSYNGRFTWKTSRRINWRFSISASVSALPRECAVEVKVTRPRKKTYVAHCDDAAILDGVAQRQLAVDDAPI